MQLVCIELYRALVLAIDAEELEEPAEELLLTTVIAEVLNLCHALAESVKLKDEHCGQGTDTAFLEWIVRTTIFTFEDIIVLYEFFCDFVVECFVIECKTSYLYSCAYT